LRSEVPYLAWADVGTRHYDWYAPDAGSGMHGWLTTVNMRLTQNFSVEMGNNSNSASNSDSSGYGGFFAMLNFHLADLDRPVALSSNFVSNRAFGNDRMDLSSHTLDQVRRENRILVERKNLSSGSVILARGG
jgi:hypothetical protein